MTLKLVHPLLTALAQGSLVGAVIAYAGTAAPTGWVLCYGQNVSRTSHAALFAIIGTTYGAGDGSTTFTLPDLRGRVVAGQDDMGGSSANRLTGLSGGVNGDVLGGTGGAESHTLMTAELASHLHTVDPNPTASGTVSSDHTHSGSTGTESANHQHLFNTLDAGGGGGTQVLRASAGVSNTQSTGSQNAAHTHAFTTGGISANHTHTTDIASFNSGSTGSGGAHNNVQPTLILNYIIHSGVF